MHEFVEADQVDLLGRHRQPVTRPVSHDDQPDRSHHLTQPGDVVIQRVHAGPVRVTHAVVISRAGNILVSGRQVRAVKIACPPGHPQG